MTRSGANQCAPQRFRQKLLNCGQDFCHARPLVGHQGLGERKHVLEEARHPSTANAESNSAARY
jgi:hypothetical protein